MMRKLVCGALFIVCCSAYGFAQPPDEYLRNEVFAGYSFNSADINTLTITPGRTSQNGVNIAYTRKLTHLIGLTFDVSGHFKRDTFLLAGRQYDRKRDQYYFLGGLQFKSEKPRVSPFVHALVGGALFRGVASSITPSGNNFFIDDATSFAMALGGGLDVRASKHVDIRIIQLITVRRSLAVATKTTSGFPSE